MINTSRRRFLQASSLLPLGVATPLLADSAESVIAATVFGKVEGRRQAGVNVFKGIPYGANTGGANRFKPARDPEAWSGIRQALEYGAAAPQSDPATGRQQDDNESEDCLVLNVWSRGINDNGKRPVMFWIHGGGFRTLSGSSPGYDGTNLCLRGDVVVVTINHRLNCLGYTHFAELGGDDYAHSGNVGMLDIVHALKWVNKNIAEFGGDPERVMIFGESGGGRKVATLLGMPDAKGLFHAAVIESGATLKVAEPAQATQLAQSLLAKLSLNKNNFQKIHDMPLAQIMAAYQATASSTLGSGYQPVMDGVVLPHHPFYPTASPVNPDVPLIVGANRTEMTYFARGQDDFNLTEAQMQARVAELVGESNRDKVIATYRKAVSNASPSEIYFLVFSDHRYVMASVTIAERRAALQKAPVYLYYLTWQSPSQNGRLMSPHSLDIPFIFDNVRTNPLTRGSETAITLADKVSDTFIEFARTGNPNSGKLPTWRQFDDKNHGTMVLNDQSAYINDPLSERRQLMQSILNL